MNFDAFSEDGVQCVNIVTKEDDFVEDSESFAVELRVSGNDVIKGNNSLMITITDNDSKFVFLTAQNEMHVQPFA